MDMQTTLLTSLRKLALQHTEDTLGDRRDYLGASDVGYCPRKVILEKIQPGEHDLATLLRFQRGHMAEDIIAMAFTAAGYTNFERQVEVVIEGDVPLKAHIDFVFTSTIYKIKSILEVKSTGNIPEGPYSSWESQLYIQMGALANQYPDYAIRGAVLALDLADGEVGFFNGYVPQETIYHGLLQRAGSIWSDYQALLQGEEREIETEVSPLCGFCSHLATCPKFAAEEVPQLADSVNSLQELQAREKGIQAEIKQLKTQLLAVVEQKGPITSGGCFLKKATRTRKYLDIDRLQAFLSENGIPLGEYQEDRSFSFLEIRNKSAKAA
jgi:CRISPR-associated exonuclease Cas4